MRQDKRVMITRFAAGEAPNLRIMAEMIARKIMEEELRNGRKV